MPESDHEALVGGAIGGDAVAIEVLLERHLPSLLGYLRLHTDPVIRRHESCADLAQSVCRDVLEDLDGFEYRGEASFLSWLCTKALGKLVNRKRYYLALKRDAGRAERLTTTLAGAGLPALYATLASPSQDAVAHETAARVEAAFDRLPEDYRRVITLSRIIGMSHDEIAVELGRDVGATRVLLHRALVRLGRLMHESHGPDAAR